MHLAFVVNNPDFLVSHRLVLVRGALKAGYRVSVIAPPGDGHAVLRAEGCETHEWRLQRTGQKPHLEAISLAHLVALYARLKPDLAHHVTVKAMLYGAIAARTTRVPATVNAVSGLGYVFLSQGLVATARKTALTAAYRFALTAPNSAVILQNDDDERSLNELGVLGGARVVKIRGSGVDLTRYPPTPEPTQQPPLVVMPARLLVDKGVREFVEAARTLKGTARFALVGGFDEGNPAGIPISELDVWVREGVVEAWGHRRDMPNVLQQANVVCLPSYREGMPKALLEAAATGRAIVTTDVPGCRDAVAGGQIGELVPVRDAGALADALRWLLASPAQRSRLGSVASAYASANFSEINVLEKHLELYRTLLASNHVR
ncbi:MAG: glycosyltransferase family 4 protein [Archangium sp.]